MTDAECSNYELYALAQGLAPGAEHPDRTVRRALIRRDRRHCRAALGLGVRRLAEIAYPWTAVHPATVERSEALLASSDLDEGIRRSVLDAGDDLRRALAAREQFAARSSLP